MSGVRINATDEEGGSDQMKKKPCQGRLLHMNIRSRATKPFYGMAYIPSDLHDVCIKTPHCMAVNENIIF